MMELNSFKQLENQTQKKKVLLALLLFKTAEEKVQYNFLKFVNINMCKINSENFWRTIRNFIIQYKQRNSLI